MLILSVQPGIQLVALRELAVQSQLPGEGVLHETALQRSVGRGHIAMRDGFRQLLAHVVLIGQVQFQRRMFVSPRSVTEHLQVVHPLIGQVDVAARAVVVDVGEPHLQSVSIGKEAALGIGVGDAHVGVEVVAGIAQHQTAAALASGCVAQSSVLQANPVRIILYAVGGHLVVGIVHVGGMGPVDELAQPSAYLGRSAQRLVVGPPHQLHGSLNRALRDVGGKQVEHTAYGIGAIEQGRRSLDHFGAVNGKLVYLQAVIVAPLLALMLHAVFGHGHTVEAQATNGGLGKAGTYRHGFHPGNALQGLHQAASKVFLQIVFAHLHAVLRALHLLTLARHARHLDILNGYRRVGRFLHAQQHSSTQYRYHVLLRCDVRRLYSGSAVLF